MENSKPASPSVVPRLWAFAVGCVALTLAFASPLYHWGRLALSVDLHSHVILIPVISGYLIWRNRNQLPQVHASSWRVASLFGLGATGLILTAWRWEGALVSPDGVALTVGAYLMAGVGLGFACFGMSIMRALSFPVAFLIFMIPVPSGLEMLLEQILQRFSADAAHLIFWLAGETFLRDGQVFLLPGLTIRVAQECSGIRSSLVLFILSLLSAHVMLRSTWHRALLVFAVLPLGILRNGVRVYVITALTLHVNPGIIDSPLHHRGGPLFFALSLIPFTALLWFLWKREQSPGRRKPESHPA